MFSWVSSSILSRWSILWAREFLDHFFSLGRNLGPGQIQPGGQGPPFFRLGFHQQVLVCLHPEKTDGNIGPGGQGMFAGQAGRGQGKTSDLFLVTVFIYFQKTPGGLFAVIPGKLEIVRVFKGPGAVQSDDDQFIPSGPA